MLLIVRNCIFFCILFASINAISNIENNDSNQFSALILCGSSFLLICMILIITCVRCPPFIRDKAFTNLESDLHIFGRPRGYKSSEEFRIRVHNTNEPQVTFESLPDLSVISKNQSLNWVNWYRPRIISEKIVMAYEDDKELEKIIKSLGRFILPRNKLNHIKEIGNGWFGKIILGDIDGNKIIIQSLGGTPTTNHKILFLKETAAFRQLKHKNLLNAPFYCLDHSPILCILELCHLEDLKSYLRSHVIAIESLENKGLPIRFALDMAHGLKFLHDNNFIHRDFAIRNCLLTSDMICKVGDYGNTEELYQEDYFDCDGVMLPIRWMPPESIVYKNNDIIKIEINKLTNIWSFGVALWELFMFGALPYSDLANEGVLRLVIVDASVKLPPPSIHVRGWMKIYELMNMCWFGPEYRPNLSKLINLMVCLRDELQKNPATLTIDGDKISPFERKWQQMRGGDDADDLNPSDVFDNPISVINDNFDMTAVAFMPATGHHAKDFNTSLCEFHNGVGSLITAQFGVNQISLINNENEDKCLEFENSLLNNPNIMRRTLYNIDSTTGSLLGNPGSKEMSIKEESSPMHQNYLSDDDEHDIEVKNDNNSDHDDDNMQTVYNTVKEAKMTDININNKDIDYSDHTINLTIKSKDDSSDITIDAHLDILNPNSNTMKLNNEIKDENSQILNIYRDDINYEIVTPIKDKDHHTENILVDEVMNTFDDSNLKLSFDSIKDSQTKVSELNINQINDDINSDNDVNITRKYTIFNSENIDNNNYE